MKLKGIDVSKYQGNIDYTLLQSQVQFVISKVSEGVGYVDPTFVNNYNGTKSKGLGIGCYHFARPDLGNSAEAEANFFTKTIASRDGISLYVLDIEVTYGDLVNWSKAFLDKVYELTKVKPLIYLNQSQVKNNNWQEVIAGGYGLWLAQYDYNFDGAPAATPWPFVALRQYSNKEIFNGITGNVDANVFYGDREAFNKYGQMEVEPTSLVITDQTKIPQIDNMEVQAIRSVINDQKNTINSLQAQVTSLVKDNGSLKEQISILESNNPNVCCGTLQRVKDVLFGKGFWFIKYFKIKEILREVS